MGHLYALDCIAPLTSTHPIPQRLRPHRTQYGVQRHTVPHVLVRAAGPPCQLISFTMRHPVSSWFGCWGMSKTAAFLLLKIVIELCVSSGINANRRHSHSRIHAQTETISCHRAFCLLLYWRRTVCRCRFSRPSAIFLRPWGVSV
jgi:hypothetical protein